MHRIDQLDYEILNATADDWEDLEQIFLSVCFEYVDGSATEEGLHRRVKPTTRLPEVADRIHALVTNRLLCVDAEHAPLTAADLSYLWRGWFAMTSEGRQAWSSFEAASLAPTE